MRFVMILTSNYITFNIQFTLKLKIQINYIKNVTYFPIYEVVHRENKPVAAKCRAESREW